MTVDPNSFVTLMAGIYAALGIVTIIASVGMAWSVIRATMKERDRRLESLETSRGNIYARINPMGESIARMEGKLDAVLKTKR